MELNQKQNEIKALIEQYAPLFNVDPSLAKGIAMTESSMGINLKSPTGCLGVFQMSNIAMKDVWQTFATDKGLLKGVLCGLMFLDNLTQRYNGDVDNIIGNFCDPADRNFYIDRVKGYMQTI